MTGGLITCRSAGDGGGPDCCVEEQAAPVRMRTAAERFASSDELLAILTSMVASPIRKRHGAARNPPNASRLGCGRDHPWIGEDFGRSLTVTPQIQEAVLLHVPDPPASRCAYPRLELPGAHFETMGNALFVGEDAIASLAHGSSCRVRFHCFGMPARRTAVLTARWIADGWRRCR